LKKEFEILYNGHFYNLLKIMSKILEKYAMSLELNLRITESIKLNCTDSDPVMNTEHRIINE